MSESDPENPQGGEVLPDGFVVTDPETARERLREEQIGIVGLGGADGEPPELRPVNYAVFRSYIVIRTDRGLLFEAARKESVATLAVVSFDRDTRAAWSVIVKGKLDVGSDVSDGTTLVTWAASDKAERIRLTIDEISGRHLPARTRD